jgi:hypothetical protein
MMVVMGLMRVCSVMMMMVVRWVGDQTRMR